ncbi:hypothetical protein GCM10007420_18030 [Glycocaulis albus]|uniref:Uncharacterized protein n=1 Tax=Glycocaulis albus TaxID=1382801 RepID=A0ABQ1XTD9_9PROT|nr:hypothetical protein GCM10007420_18030 [Glycocaulis albus]
MGGTAFLSRVSPAQAGAQIFGWIPAFAGKTQRKDFQTSSFRKRRQALSGTQLSFCKDWVPGLPRIKAGLARNDEGGAGGIMQ